MSKVEINSSPQVKEIFDKYPDSVKEQMKFLRELVIETANETEGVDKLVETLKWGEPSYMTKIGSTLRMDWKEKTPDQYAMYFQCNSRLVNTFRVVFDDTFQYEGKRAIVFKLNQEIPVEALKECIRATLTYHKVKNELTLGI